MKPGAAWAARSLPPARSVALEMCSAAAYREERWVAALTRLGSIRVRYFVACRAGRRAGRLVDAARLADSAQPGRSAGVLTWVPDRGQDCDDMAARRGMVPAWRPQCGIDPYARRARFARPQGPARFKAAQFKIVMCAFLHVERKDNQLPSTSLRLVLPLPRRAGCCCEGSGAQPVKNRIWNVAGSLPSRSAKRS